MEDNRNLVTEVAENVEQTTEETQQNEKLYTQAEVDKIVGTSKARARAKAEREYSRKYGELIDVLEAGSGEKGVENITNVFRDHYERKGIEMRQKDTYSSADLGVLAKADADEIIRGGYDEVVEEADRLADLGADKMTAREKATFEILAKYVQNAERSRELEELGVTEEEYTSADFTEFATMFDSKTPIAKIWNIYANNKSKKDIKTAGSMKNTSATDDGVKEFYTPEEARRFTVEDFNRNPTLLAKVEASMKKWRK